MKTTVIVSNDSPINLIILYIKLKTKPILRKLEAAVNNKSSAEHIKFILYAKNKSYPLYVQKYILDPR